MYMQQNKIQTEDIAWAPGFGFIAISNLSKKVEELSKQIEEIKKRLDQIEKK